MQGGKMAASDLSGAVDIVRSIILPWIYWSKTQNALAAAHLAAIIQKVFFSGIIQKVDSDI